jgi:hypothetical protein
MFMIPRPGSESLADATRADVTVPVPPVRYGADIASGTGSTTGTLRLALAAAVGAWELETGDSPAAAGAQQPLWQHPT